MRRSALALFACMVAPFASAATWTRVTSPEFELFTTAGERQGRDTIRHFEEVHDFFLKASPLRDTSTNPVRIILFNSPDEYAPYRFNEFAAAYFSPSPARDSIVIGGVAPEINAIAVHEYMHLVVRHSGMVLPLWLNEGWADVYSTLRIEGKDTLIGDLIPRHVEILRREKWLDFNTLTSADKTSAYYTESTQATIFYAESWALAHMLYLSHDYQPGFGKFVTALNAGKSAGEACQIAFGKSPDKVFEDLRSYFDRKQLFGRAFAATAKTGALAITASTVPEFETKLMQADLLATSGHKVQAAAAYESLKQEQPGRVDLAESMGFLAWENGDAAGARRAFEIAFDGGDQNSALCFALAQLEAAAKQPPARVVAVLERVVHNNPDSVEARLQLGLARVSARDFTKGIEDLMAVPTIKADRAMPVYCALAYASIETGDLAGARRNVETCRTYAKGDQQTRTAQGLVKLIASRAEGPAAVHPGEQRALVSGTLRAVACTPQAMFLTIGTAGKMISFLLPSGDAIELDVAAGQPVTLSCGAQEARQIQVEYVPGAMGGSDSAGVVRRLKF